MKASTRLPFLMASVLACSVALAQFQGTYYGPTSLPIPSSGTGGPGACGTGSANTTEFTLSVPDAFILSHIRCELTLTHTYVGDLTLTLRHCGTSVVLYDRSPGSSNDLNGTYAFDDSAILYFANAVAGANPIVPPTTYLPVNPLTPFHGKSTGGDWTISICDHASGDFGQLTDMNLVLYGAQQFGGGISPALAIQDGSWTCVAPLTYAINVPTTGTLDLVSLEIGLTHPFVADLDITLSHDGVAVPLVRAGTINNGISVNGLYTFEDPTGITPPFVTVANATPSGFDVPPGTYGPDHPLSAFVGHSEQGVWLLTICDTAIADVGTLSAAILRLSKSAYALTLSQPFGSASLVFSNSGGLPGHAFLNLATVVPGSFPNGWLNGLDISFSDIQAEINLGAPVIGTLGSCGSAITSIPGTIPSNLPIQFVSFELSPSGTPVASVRAFQYITQ